MGRTRGADAPRSPRQGFTIVELFVVMAIIALLIGLMMPAIQKARFSAARGHCQSNLHNVGIAFHHYTDVNKGKFPDAARVPSLPDTPGQKSLQEVLGPFIENSANVFRCPLDQTRFQVEGTSYEYQPRVAGKTIEEVRNNKLGLPITSIWLVYDFDPVHGPTSATSRTYLYVDGHVE